MRKVSGKGSAAPIRFTPEEKEKIRAAAHATWNEISYDVMTMVQEEGKTSIPRSHVLELVCDASRLEDRISDGDLRTKLGEYLQQGHYPGLLRMLRPSFPYRHYGM